MNMGCGKVGEGFVGVQRSGIARILLDPRQWWSWSDAISGGGRLPRSGRKVEEGQIC